MSHHLRAVAVASVLSASISSTPSSGEPAGAVELSCRMELPEARVRIGGPAELRFTLCNDAKTPAAILRWHTPLEGFWSDLLEVTHQGQPVAYRGPMAKRGAPARDDYVVLEPGQCRSATLDVARGYDLRRRGDYSVRWQRGVLDIAPPGEVPRTSEAHRALPLTCGSVTLKVMG